MANEQTKTQEHVIFACRTGMHKDFMLRKVDRDDVPQLEDFVTFEHGLFETNDADVIAKLRAHPSNEKNAKNKAIAKTFRELNDLDARIMREKIMKSGHPKRLYVRQLAVLNGEVKALFGD